MRNILITGGSGFIGTNLIKKLLLGSDCNILNIDINYPKIEMYNKYWVNVDIRNKSLLKSEFQKFKPTIMVHLAAQTDLDGISIEDYSTNTIGTKNIVEILNEIGFGGLAIFSSSMYVCEPGYKPVNFDDYHPHTIYGKSKVETEKIIKLANLNFTWTIIRPTSIWGPWFSEPYLDFFNIVLSKKYIHIGNHSCTKTYGYIENTIAQIEALMDSPHDLIHKKIFYLGDWPEYKISDWANEISATVPYNIKTFPLLFFIGLGKFGDFCKILGVKFPMTSFRLKNMTTDNVHDLKPIRNVLPNLPSTRIEGIIKTVDWIKKNEI